MNTITNTNNESSEERGSTREAYKPMHRFDPVDTEYYSARQICEKEIFYWRKSYKTTIKYINYYGHILKPIRMGTKSGVRYYILGKNLKEFVWMFENNKLC